MSDNKYPSRLHIHLGGLIIIIIIVLILFKVDLKSTINSPRLQENVSYLEDEGLSVWNNYLSKPLKRGWDGLFNTLLDKGIKQIKSGISKNLTLPNINKTIGVTNSTNK